MAPPAEPQRSNTLPATRPSRPKFNSMLTSDRLRESYLYRPLPHTTAAASRKPRRSVFRELGLDGDDDTASDGSSSAAAAPELALSPGRDASASPEWSAGPGPEGRWKTVDWDDGEEASLKMGMEAQAAALGG